MDCRSCHVLPDKFKPLLEEIFVLLSPPFADFTSIEIWIKARLFRAKVIVNCALEHAGKGGGGGATYSTISIPIAYSTMERITLGIPVCREVTMEGEM